MEVKQLEAVVAIADEGSVTGAARRLRLVQPAVSRQIQTLEKELGVALFERTRSGMLVTPAGSLLVERARRVIRELDRARVELQPTPHDVGGTVSVGLLESMTDLLAGPLVTRVREAHPRVHLRVLTAYSGHLRDWLNAGDLDLAVLYDLPPSPSFSVEPAGEEQLWAFAPPEAALRVGTPIPLTELTHVPLILPESGHGLRVLIDRAFARLGLQPHASVETNSMRIQKSLVQQGHGWTILPAVGAAAEVASRTLSGAPLCAPDIRRTVSLVTHKQERQQPSIQAVAAQLTRCIDQARSTGSWPGMRQ
ncbi:LysR substrate-binding domain-containing protein [Nocardioides sp. AE5]|uniref:LysR family transcriptional regulator n=1 Tax=Nocardioides sp. AE5 TaxID=2962573 RepID=UPI002880E236|nr:LysR substrate-binding domain-containing protein [Nocardioides sp. AE5]MDT0203166.1 LysR substrate-binding domain-containing protein [Nocardioides sp. AE5]